MCVFSVGVATDMVLGCFLRKSADEAAILSHFFQDGAAAILSPNIISNDSNAFT